MKTLATVTAAWCAWPVLALLLTQGAMAQPPPPPATIPVAAGDNLTPRDRVRQSLREHFQQLRENRGAGGELFRGREGGPGMMPPPPEGGQPLEDAPAPPWGNGRDGKRPPMADRMAPPGERGGPGGLGGAEARRAGPPPLEHFMERWRTQNPEEFDRLKELHRDDPAAFREAIKQLSEKKFKEYREAQQAMEAQLQDLVQQYQKAADDAGRTQVKGKMTALLGQGFDERLKAHEASVSQMETQLATARKQLAERREKRDEIIAARITSLLYPPDPDEAPTGRAGDRPQPPPPQPPL